MQTKRTVFPNRVLPYLLVAPQMAITIIFFLWPAGQTAANALVLPFNVAVAIPQLTGEQLSETSDCQIAIEKYRSARKLELGVEFGMVASRIDETITGSAAAR